MAIEGKVAKVLNSRELIINKGTSDGVKPGMKFNVQGTIDIVDPDSHEDLGHIVRPKISVEVVEAEPRFSIAMTFETYEAYNPAAAAASLLATAFQRRPRKIRLGEDAEFQGEVVSVSIGDPVVQIFSLFPEDL